MQPIARHLQPVQPAQRPGLRTARRLLVRQRRAHRFGQPAPKERLGDRRPGRPGGRCGGVRRARRGHADAAANALPVGLPHHQVARPLHGRLHPRHPQRRSRPRPIARACKARRTAGARRGRRPGTHYLAQPTLRRYGRRSSGNEGVHGGNALSLRVAQRTRVPDNILADIHPAWRPDRYRSTNCDRARGCRRQDV